MEQSENPITNISHVIAGFILKLDEDWLGSGMCTDTLVQLNKFGEKMERNECIRVKFSFETGRTRGIK